MGLFDTIRRAVGGEGATTDGDEQAAGDDQPSDDEPRLLDTRSLDPTAFREYAEHVVDGADPLTFSPDTLGRLDRAIEKNSDDRTAGEESGETVYTENTIRFGSYLGEVLVRAYDGEWVGSDGRWGVTVADSDDERTVAVFDVAAHSFGGEPVFAAVTARLESELELDTNREGESGDGPSTDNVVSAPTQVASSAASETVEGESAPEPADASRSDTEPTRVVQRVQSEQADGEATDGSAGEEPAADTSPTRVVRRVSEPAETESPSESDTASEEGKDPRVDDTAATEGSISGGADTESTVTDQSESERATASTRAEQGSDGSTDTPVQGTADQSAVADTTEHATGEVPPQESGKSVAQSWEPETLRAKHAETAVEFADFWGEYDLNFTPESLGRLDDLVAAQWDDERFDESTFGSDASFDDRAFTSVVTELGSYFGEVLV
ncbi:MAG: hypothetical protein ABEH86_06600, partial [Haloarcula sp.]